MDSNQSSGTTITLDSLAARVTNLENQRINQQQILPQAVKQRHIQGSVIFSGTVANLPKDGTTEVQAYFATDTNTFYLWNGSAWVPATPASGFKSGCSVYLSGSQSVGAGSFVKLTFDTTLYDGLTEFDTVNHKFVATTAGRYLVTCNPVTSLVTDTQSVLGAIYKNGSIAYSTALQSGNIGAGITSQVTAIMNLAPADYIEFYVLQSDSGAHTFIGGTTSTVAMIQRLA